MDESRQRATYLAILGPFICDQTDDNQRDHRYTCEDPKADGKYRDLLSWDLESSLRRSSCIRS